MVRLAHTVLYLAICGGCAAKMAGPPQVPAEFGRVNLEMIRGGGDEVRGDPVVVLRAVFEKRMALGATRQGEWQTSYSAVRWKVLEVEHGTWKDGFVGLVTAWDYPTDVNGAGIVYGLSRDPLDSPGYEARFWIDTTHTPPRLIARQSIGRER